MPNIIEITDFEAPELDVYARLNENQLLNRHEPEKGLLSPKAQKSLNGTGCRLCSGFTFTGTKTC